MKARQQIGDLGFIGRRVDGDNAFECRSIDSLRIGGVVAVRNLRQGRVPHPDRSGDSRYG